MERWKLVGHGIGGNLTVLTAEKRPSFYSRRADGTRWSISWSESGAVLKVEEANGWTVLHQSEHPSERAAKNAAKALLAEAVAS